MSTTQTAESADFTATLVRGRCYFLKGREFLVGEPQQVSAADKAWLEAHAIDLVSVEGEAEHQERQKFEFTATGEEPKPAASRRARGPVAP